MYSDPKLKDAFRKSIKHYFKNAEFKEYDKTNKRRFNKKYLDGMETDLFPSEDVKKGRKKIKKEVDKEI